MPVDSMISMLQPLLKTMISSYQLWSPCFRRLSDSSDYPHMQEHTNPGGYNLIVCAMDTEDYPAICPSRLPLKKENWRSITRIGELVKYMKIQAISIVEMRMAIGFNLDLQPCWQRK